MLVYLDTNVWNYLVDRPQDMLTVELLLRASKAGHIEVVGSLALDEELLGIGRSDRLKYKKVRRVYHRLVDERLLLPLNERHIAETVGGGALANSHRYLDRRRQRLVKQELYSRKAIAEVGDLVHAEKQRLRSIQIDARDGVRDTLRAAGVDPVDAVRKWHLTTDPNEWLADIAQHGADKGLTPRFELDEIGPDLLPSASLTTRYEMARAKRTLADNRAIRDSDRYDAEHVAAGAYYDRLVTNDTELINTLSDIVDLPFVTLRPEEFAAELHLLLGDV